MKLKTTCISIICILFIFISLLFFTACGGDKKPEKAIKPHILLITIDTLRRDHLSGYGYPRHTSPFMDQLANEGVRFQHAIVPIPSTASSHASILTALHPLTHRITSNASPLDDNVQTIAEVLKANGYFTIGTTAVTFLSKEYNFAQGFDSFSGKWKEGPGAENNFQRDATAVNKQLFKQIDDYMLSHKDKPLFIWVHYYDPHWPYEKHPDITFKNPLKERNDNKFIIRYDQEIRYTDAHIKQLHQYLETKGIAKQLITCITGDHGEEFFEHGNSYCHTDFYSENTYVPLIIHGHGVPTGKVREEYVSTMDIAPTLLKKAGLTFDIPVEGIDLLNDDDKKIPNRKFFIIGNAKYTRSLQVMSYPHSYVLNFDKHYKNWFLTGKNNLDDKLFKPLRPNQLKKKKHNKTEIFLKRYMDKGLNYLVLRADIKKNKGLTLQIKMLPYALTKEVKVSPKIKQLNVIYPVTIRDRVIPILDIKEGTIIENYRLAIIPKKEFPKEAKHSKTLNNKIFKKLGAQRKDHELDEIFDLTTDVGMFHNLEANPELKPKMIESKKLAYALYKFYFQKGTKLLSGKAVKSDLSEQEKTMLKSLGYL